MAFAAVRGISESEDCALVLRLVVFALVLVEAETLAMVITDVVRARKSEVARCVNVVGIGDAGRNGGWYGQEKKSQSGKDAVFLNVERVVEGGRRGASGESGRNRQKCHVVEGWWTVKAQWIVNQVNSRSWLRSAWIEGRLRRDVFFDEELTIEQVTYSIRRVDASKVR